MKAKNVSNFTRGGDPYKKLGVGLGHKVTLGIKYEGDDAKNILYRDENNDRIMLSRILDDFMDDIRFDGRYRYHSNPWWEWLGANTIEVVLDVLVDDPERIRTLLVDEWGPDEFKGGKSVGGAGWPRWKVVEWDGK